MFHHTICHGSVVIKLKDCLEFGADNFQLDLRNGIVRVSSMIVIQNKLTKKIPVVFWCTYCDKIIEDIKEVGCNCAYCGKPKCADEMFIHRGGSLICISCKKKTMSRDEIAEKDFTSLLGLFKDGLTPPEIRS
jgi:hypothetical protein